MDERKFKRLAKKSLELELEEEENFSSDGMFYMVRCPKCGKENHGFFVALGRCAWCGHDEATDKQKAWRKANKAKLDEIKARGGRMSSYERHNGQMYNIEPNLLNRTAAEQIDDYQMKIYEIVKEVFPDAIGYSAECAEEEGHVKTNFRVHRKPIRLGEKE